MEVLENPKYHPHQKKKTVNGTAAAANGKTAYYKVDEKSEDAIFLLPFKYITQIPGKNIRSKLARAFNYWLNVPEEKLALIEEIVQTVHNDSLLLDDIQDNSVLRRGVPVAHAIYGVPITINAVLLTASRIIEKVLALNHPQAIHLYTEQMLELLRGQGMELYWRDNSICPTEEEYNVMVIRKTGSLFIMILKLMQLFSSNKQDFTKLIRLLGLVFQILDDYQNLHSDAYMATKSYCEDLTEGKFSFPIIHAINTNPNDGEILDILRQRTTDHEIKKRCVNLLEKYGSFEYTRNKLNELTKEALQELEKFGENPHLNAVVEFFFQNASEVIM